MQAALGGQRDEFLRIGQVGRGGRPSPSTCVATLAVEKPNPPAARAAPSNPRIAPICAGLALSVEAAGPMTARRMAEWPTMKPILRASGLASTTSSSSANDSHS